MVDNVIRPFAGLFLCLLIGAVLLCLPYIVATVRGLVDDIRRQRAERARTSADEQTSRVS